MGEFTGRYDPLQVRTFALFVIVPIALGFAVVKDPWLHLYNSSYSLTFLPDYEVPFQVSEASWNGCLWLTYCPLVGLVC